MTEAAETLRLGRYKGFTAVVGWCASDGRYAGTARRAGDGARQIEFAGVAKTRPDLCRAFLGAVDDVLRRFPEARA